MNNQPQHKLATISFVEATKNGVDLWPTVNEPDYAEASEIGRSRAREILQYAADNQAPMVLGHVAAAIIGKAVCGPTERSFFHEVAVRSLPDAPEVSTAVPIARENPLKLVHSNN